MQNDSKNKLSLFAKNIYIIFLLVKKLADILKNTVFKTQN